MSRTSAGKARRALRASPCRPRAGRRCVGPRRHGSRLRCAAGHARSRRSGTIPPRGARTGSRSKTSRAPVQSRPEAPRNRDRLRGGPVVAAGPQIELLSPSESGVYRGGFPIEVAFRSGKTGIPVDLGSVRITYKRAWGIDITSRLRQYISDSGIRVPMAELPVGRHVIEIYLEDVDRNISRARFSVTVVE